MNRAGSAELYNGPTLAFKGLAMQLLGNLLEYELGRRDEQMNIVGATSGDTGSAAEHAMRGKQRKRGRFVRQSSDVARHPGLIKDQAGGCQRFEAVNRIWHWVLPEMPWSARPTRLAGGGAAKRSAAGLACDKDGRDAKGIQDTALPSGRLIRRRHRSS